MTIRPYIAALLALALVAAGATWSGAADAAIVPKGNDRFELVFWDSIKDSDNPADYEAYLEAYPDGRFAPLAKVRVKTLREEQAKQRRATADIEIEEMDIEYDVVRNASLREGPTAASRRIDTLDRGTRVIVTGRVVDSEWFRVETKDTRKKGFVFGQLIAEAKRAPAGQPAAAAPASQPEKPAAQPEAKKPEQVAAVAPPPSATKAPAVDLEVIKDCPECPELVVLPPGSFVMGSPQGDESERPQHRVNIGSPFAIGRHEVTLEQWKACFDDGGCKYMPDKQGMAPHKPVFNLSWVDAQQYVDWLSKKTGKKYRLPTEAEWEYAARARTTSSYWWGDTVGSGNANCNKCGGEWDRRAPAEVDAFAANPFGLYGMNGGVWEWSSDCWFDDHKGAPADGSSREVPNCRSRVLRGGSWRNDASYARSASRFTYDFDVRYVLNGFRVARSVE